MKQNIPNNNFEYCRMQYQNNLFIKFAKILNNHPNNITIAFKTINNFIKQINYGTKNFKKTFSTFDNSELCKLKYNCNQFCIGKTNRNFVARFSFSIQIMYVAFGSGCLQKVE